jgi:hypothetical protein
MMSFSELDVSRQSESASESDFREEQHAFRKGLRLKMQTSAEIHVEPINPLQIKKKDKFFHPFA